MSQSTFSIKGNLTKNGNVKTNSSTLHKRYIFVSYSKAGLKLADLSPSFFKSNTHDNYKIVPSVIQNNLYYVFASEISRSRCFHYVRIIECDARSAEAKKINKLDHKNFRAEGFFDILTKSFRAIRSIPTVVSKVDDTIDKINKVVDPINTYIVEPAYKISDFISGVVSKISQWISIFFEKSKCSFTDFYQLIGSLYESIRSFSPRLEDDNIEMQEFQPQILDTVILASIFSGAIGSRLSHIFRNLSLFTRFKILDDINVVQDCIAYIFELPFLVAMWIATKTDNNGTIHKGCLTFADLYSKYFLEKVPFTRINRFVADFEKIKHIYDINNSVLAQTEFKEKWTKFFKDFNSWRLVFTSYNRNLPFKILNLDKQIHDFNIRVVNFTSATRTEPLCFLFYGPPGTGKSTLMNYLIHEVGQARTVYTHASNEDRDFYDHYENEDIFVMDDLGQKGIYQWADIINMVSTIRYPLNCAEVTKKGTKHFTSSLLLFSSNTNPANLVLTSDCGITDKEALCRRIKMFDFSKVTFIDGKWSGMLSLCVRNSALKKWDIVHGINITDNESLIFEVICLMNEFSKKQERTSSYVPKGTYPKLYIPGKNDNPTRITKINGEVEWINQALDVEFFDPISTIEEVSDNYSELSNTSFIEDDDPSILRPSNRPIQGFVFDDEVDMSIPYAEDLIMVREELKKLDFVAMERKEEARKASFQYNFIKLLCNLAEFVVKCVRLDFESFEDFRRHFIILITNSASKIIMMGAAIASFLSAIIFVLYYAIGKLFKRKTQWHSDVTYTSRPISKAYVSDFRPEGMDMLKQTLRNYLDNYAFVKPSKHSFFFTLTGISMDTGYTTQVHGICMCSGRSVVIPHHYFSRFDMIRKLFITIETVAGAILVDNAPFTLLDSYQSDDMVVGSIKVGYQFPKMNFDCFDALYNNDVCISTPFGVYATGSKFQNLTKKASYMFSNVTYDISTDTPISCMSLVGLCGAFYTIPVGTNMVPFGLHTGGSVDGTKGVCRKFGNKFIAKIKESFANYDLTVITEGKPGMSIATTDIQKFNFIPDKSSYVPSVVDGIYDKERIPANLKVKVKEISKKSLLKTGNVDIDALDFAETYVRCIIPQFSTSSENEIIKGVVIDDVRVAKPIAKDTSCGFGYPGKKEDYIDYDLGVMRPHFKVEVDKFEKKLETKTWKVEDALHAEILKDELRNVEKVDKPRAFKMAPLHVVYLQRKYMLKLLINLHQNSQMNGIRVGINPYSDEWAQLMETHLNVGPSFDGDWGKWDGGMLPQFQASLNKVLVSCFKGSDKEKQTFDSLLQIIMNCPTITLDEVYFNTHSLPSGIALTAEYNSLINKMLTAYAFYILYKKEFNHSPNISQFLIHVRDDVYGDDKLVSVHPRFASWFNGRSFETIANSVGLDFTPAAKGAWTYDTQPIEKCQFLKRAFFNNDFLGRITAPLELKTIRSTLNFVKDANRNYEITHDKLLGAQRELFLHGSKVYYEEMSHINNFLKEKGLSYTFLSVDSLISLYNKGQLFPSEAEK